MSHRDNPNPLSQDEAIAAIAQVVGPAGLIQGADDQQRILIDHRRLYHGRAAAVVRPANTEQVAEVVRLCNRAGLGVVPQGGNTGYCGGATPDESGREVVVCLERMRAVREVDSVNFTMTVEAGVVLADVQKTAQAGDMFFPLSLGSEGSCQIGGNLATNAGGTAVLQYGNARELVLGLEVVLADGRIWQGLSKLRKDNAGYDLKQLFLGAEGTLGIITAAVLKLYPAPRARQTAIAAVADVQAACELLASARAVSGDAVTSFEYIPRYAMALTTTHIKGVTDPFEQPHPHYVLIELASSDPKAPLDAQLESLLAKGIDNASVRDAVVAQSEAQRLALWRIRESVPQAQREVGDSLKHDVSVPVSRLPEFLERGVALALAVSSDAQVCCYGHIGDGNLHFNFHPPAGMNLADFVARDGARIGEALYGLVRELGGSVAAEHGVGKLKRPALHTWGDPVGLQLMREVKQALDPRGLMNPGKVV